MKKKLHLIFALTLIHFSSANLFGQIGGVLVNLNQTDVTCYSSDGSITAVIPYSFLNPPPYTYSWSNGATTQTISNLSPGTYSVIVTDSFQQTGYASAIVKSYKEIKAIAVQTNASCGGTSSGSATVAVKNGSGNYTYQWNTIPEQTTQSVANLAAGNHIVTVKDNFSGCTTTAEVNIILDPTTPVGDPAIYGNNIWNVYAWNEGTFNNLPWSSAYSGYFTADTLNFNSEDYFEDYDTPSSVPGYQGCRVNGNNHSWSAKRQGFPCGYYKIDIPMHDDWVRLYINDQLIWSDDNCCESHTNVWEGYLDSNSKIEFNIAENEGQSRGSIKLNLIEPTALITDVTCYDGNDGAISLTPLTNGTYSYAWNDGITTKDRTGLSAGNYTLNITTPNGCIETKTYTVSQPSAIAIISTKTNISCHGENNGSITASATGGTGSYTYKWNTTPASIADTITGLTAGTYTVTVTDSKGCISTESVTITEPDALAASATQTNILCQGGSNGTASVSVSGGSGSYSYIWSPSGGTSETANGLAAGNYSCTITDNNGCSITKDFTITEPDALTASATQTNILCHGDSSGTASVNVSGGSGSYSYIWSPSGGTSETANGLAAGNYSCTITDNNGCSITKDFTITEPDALTASATQTNILCHGDSSGTASVNISGGSGSYSYIWSPSGGTSETANGLAAGNYSCTITDNNGCSITKDFTITEPDALTASATQTNILCHGDSSGTASVNISGGSGSYSYIWSPSGGTSETANGLAAGNYSCTITDNNGCSITKDFTITEPDALTASATQTNILCHGDSSGTASVSVSGGSGSYSYVWSPSGGTSETANGLAAGNYSCTITDNNGCSITKDFTITEPDALTASATQTNILCHGDSSGTASVSVSGGSGSYSYIWSPSGGTSETANGLAAGTYMVTISDTNSCSLTKTITINEPEALNVTAAITDVSCHNGNNGSATVNVSGGSGIYNYLWAPYGGTTATADVLTAGNYNVTITDSNSCTFTLAVIINQPTEPIVLSTSSAENITISTAVLSGTASSDGIGKDKGDCLSETGFVYALHTNPLITDTKINLGSSLGILNSALKDLKGNTTYYVRTYALNSNGYINYGNEISFTTEKYTLSITASSGHTKVYGTADPVLSYTISGLVNGDTDSIIKGSLSRDLGENVGTYNINLGTISAGTDYTVIFKGASFEITKADQIITWNQNLEFGCETQNSSILNASADSGLPITYSVDNNEIAQISGDVLNIKNSGNTTITASQNGDQNHNAASSIIKSIEVSNGGLITQKWADVLVFDNHSKEFVSWQWYKNGMAVSGATQQYYSENQTLNGTYFVIAINKEGKAIKSCPFEALETTFSNTLKLYPNPVKPSNVFTLDCNFNETLLNGASLSIFDINGKLIKTVSNLKAQNQITAPSQTAVYVLMLVLSNGEQKTINLLVK
ncbi:MBG domain-containing protein [Flavobacterium ginsenosidimutans]|uniref:MBG domain-containing protein n=1 Tax=Flavobacterium ginsenosidimutans TaxID=687844 RepID=UPI003D994152